MGKKGILGPSSYLIHLITQPFSFPFFLSPKYPGEWGYSQEYLSCASMLFSWVREE